MKITVQIKANSKMEGIEKKADGTYLVRINAPPVEGKANKAIIALLAEFFKVPKSSVILLRGQKSKSKVFEIPS